MYNIAFIWYLYFSKVCIAEKCFCNVYSFISAVKLYFKVFCDMKINGGGYTFLSRAATNRISNKDLQALQQDSTEFLMRFKVDDSKNGQRYGILQQLNRYRSVLNNV